MVRNERGQTMRYPLVRVDRVVSSTVVDWSGAAIAMCMQNGIGISWLNTRGEALGTCYPHQRRHLQFAGALELMLETPDGPERYQLWLRARRMDVLVRWGRAKPGSITQREWEATKHEWVYARKFRQHLPGAHRSHLLAYIGAQLALCGAPPVFWNAESDAVSLDTDLCELLWAEMNFCSGDLTDTTNGDKEVIALFERWIASNGAALVLHLKSLYRTAMKGMDA